VAQPQGEEAEEGARSPSVPLWRNPDFVLLFSGQAISLVGSRAADIAFPLLLLALSHSPAEAGLLGFVNRVPYIILSLPAGALVDRWNRKTVMIVCDTGRALAFSSIPLLDWTGHLTLPSVFVVALVEGIFFVFFDLAQVAALPRVVGRERLAQASAQYNILYGLSSPVGAPLGGALYGSVGRAFPFLADAVSYGASVISLLFIKTRFQAERGAAGQSLRSEIAEGLRWLWSQPIIRFLAFLAFGFNIVFFSAGYTLVLIVLAREMHTPQSLVGFIFAVSAVGGIFAALLVVPVRRRYSFRRVLIGTGWLLAAIAPLYLVAPNPVAIALIAASLSVVGTVYNITQYSYRLALIPDALQGRVNSVFRLVAFSGQPIGSALVGLWLGHFGTRPAILLLVGCLALMALATTLNASIRAAPPASDVRVD
jgi:MFS family permease